MADEKKKSEVDDKAELVSLIVAAVKAAMTPVTPGSGQKPPKRPLAPEHKGTKQYIVGPGKHWRGNRMYQAGEIVTVTDERPGRDWTLVENQARVAPSAPAARSGVRANDIDVG